jgi:hypothetical protein
MVPQMLLGPICKMRGAGGVEVKGMWEAARGGVNAGYWRMVRVLVSRMMTSS